MRDYILRSARYIAADCLRRFLLPGDTAVDATMGNGHDTLFLCELVGEKGRVYAFDIQRQAIENTKALLAENGLLENATLYQCGHERMAEMIRTPVQAVMFNLGWLPGGDKRVTTKWETTETAVRQALDLLAPEGICVICVYPGHEAGNLERIRLKEMLSGLRPQEYNVLHHCFLNAGESAPECFIIQKQICKGKILDKYAE